MDDVEDEIRTRVRGLKGEIQIQNHCVMIKPLFFVFFVLGFGRGYMESNIDDSCQRLSKISILAAFNLHYGVYAAVVLNQNMQEIENMFNGTNLYLQTYYDEVKSTQRNAPPRSRFSDIMKGTYNIDFINARNLNNAINYDRITYSTSFRNTINMNAEMYVKKLFRVFYRRRDINDIHLATSDKQKQRRISIDHTIR